MSDYTPTEAQEQARREGRFMGAAHGAASLDFPTQEGRAWDEFCDRCERLRDQAERTYNLSSKGWFGAGYEEGFELAIRPEPVEGEVGSIPLSDVAYESAFPRALEAVAMGVDFHTASDWIAENFPLSLEDTERVLRDAYREALKQGIEREDIDPTFYR